ncbi:MAG: biotin carboxylase [Ruminococcaceae bacterium]|nr:biotin carboxylase [Oscillospiraceae bacterium]
MAFENNEIKIPKRILNTLITSLSAGVVPRIGAPYIAIGRTDEINSLLDNLDMVADGGSFTRFLIGRYGSGKSFLIQLLRGYALERGFICADADLSPERRLTGVSGGGLATYRELVSNLASKACPDGNALPTILSRHLTKIKTDIVTDGILPDSSAFEAELKKRVLIALSELEGDVGGFDFARVLGEYYSALMNDNAAKSSACIRWLRGEFANKTEASSMLGFRVSTVIDGDNWYNFIKLFASLSVKLGYSGLILFVDECVNLYKIPNRISRESNYEKILTIFNDTLQGKAKNFGVIFGGTPQFLEDTRRGLFSYDALKSRLSDSKYTELGYQNLASPIIRLRRLSDNELLALVRRLTKLYMQKEGYSDAPVSDSEIESFLKLALSRAGAEELVTPREIIRDFLTVLNILRDNKNLSFDTLIKDISFSKTNESEDFLKNEEVKDKVDNKVTLFDIDI